MFKSTPPSVRSPLTCTPQVKKKCHPTCFTLHSAFYIPHASLSWICSFRTETGCYVVDTRQTLFPTVLSRGSWTWGTNWAAQRTSGIAHATPDTRINMHTYTSAPPSLHPWRYFGAVCPYAPPLSLQSLRYAHRPASNDQRFLDQVAVILVLFPSTTLLWVYPFTSLCTCIVVCSLLRMLLAISLPVVSLNIGTTRCELLDRNLAHPSRTHHHAHYTYPSAYLPTHRPTNPPCICTRREWHMGPFVH